MEAKFHQWNRSRALTLFTGIPSETVDTALCWYVIQRDSGWMIPCAMFQWPSKPQTMTPLFCSLLSLFLVHARWHIMGVGNHHIVWLVTSPITCINSLTKQIAPSPLSIIVSCIDESCFYILLGFFYQARIFLKVLNVVISMICLPKHLQNIAFNDAASRAILALSFSERKCF